MAFPAADWVEHHCRLTPHANALRSYDSGETRSWGDLEERVGRLAHVLLNEFGLRPGDRISTIMDGDIRSFELQFACMRTGLILAPLNFRLAVPELAYLCGELKPSLLVSDANWQALADEVAAEAAIPRRLATALGGSSELDAMISHAPHQAATYDLSPDTISYILFTSGTTGTPKGAMSTHSTMMWQALNQVQLCHVADTGAHVFSPAPLFHAGGLHSLSNPILFFGGEVTIASRFDAGNVVSYVGNPANKVTHLSLSPVMYKMMADTPQFAAADFSKLRLPLIAGGRVEEALRLAFEAKGVIFHTEYGGTETGPTIISLDQNDMEMLKAGSCGKRVMHIDVRLVDENGNDVPDDTSGEVWVKGPGVTVGYWNRDPSIAFTDGWFRTGDIARRDAKGYYYIVDRLKDMYKSGGENVSSLEVEMVLLQHPAIAECAIIGVPDPKWGEVGLAVVRAEAGHDVTLDLVRQACEPHLARYKLPKYVELVDQFPRNVTGKISKADLRARFGGSRNA